MSLRFECPGCSRTVRVRDELVGKRVRCPRCRRTTTVEDPDERPEPPEDRGSPRRGIGRHLGWVGLAIVLFAIGMGTAVRLSPLPDAVRLAAGILMLATLLVGEVACFVGGLSGRGEAGGALGVLIGLMFCAWATIAG